MHKILLIFWSLLHWSINLWNLKTRGIENESLRHLPTVIQVTNIIGEIQRFKELCSSISQATSFFTTSSQNFSCLLNCYLSILCLLLHYPMIKFSDILMVKRDILFVVFGISVSCPNVKKGSFSWETFSIGCKPKGTREGLYEE